MNDDEGEDVLGINDDSDDAPAPKRKTLQQNWKVYFMNRRKRATATDSRTKR